MLEIWTYDGIIYLAIAKGLAGHEVYTIENGELNRVGIVNDIKYGFYPYIKRDGKVIVIK